MIECSRLVSLVQTLPEAKVLCVGDVMLDRYVRGDVERISPEAPIPVLRVEHESTMLGGAGNVVRNLVALGSRVSFVAAVGDDPAGHDVAALLAELPTVEATLIIAPGRKTSIKTRFLAGNQQLIRADHETTDPVDGEISHRILDAAATAISTWGCDVVDVCDYGKGVLCQPVVRSVIAAAREAGKPVIVDPKGDDYRRYRGASLVTPNLRELGEAARMPVRGDDEIVAAARQLIDANDVGAILATRGRDGMTLVTSDGGVTHLQAEARGVFDVSGAGDTVVAAVSAALSVQRDLRKAAALANVAAGIVVEKVGTAAVYASELISALHRHGLSRSEAKVLPLEPAMDRIHVWRRRGLKIGFTNGCFDLLHPGHASLLSRARDACDKLVVGLNSDSSVRRLKGPKRPVQTEAARAVVLGSLGVVDMVVIFPEDTPLKLIEAIRPDVLIKGADYRPGEVVGAAEVRSYGGSVLLLDLEPSHSTTATIARIASVSQRHVSA